MARKKLDVVIEAVRYAAGGQVALARVYQRRGPTYSDCFLLSRDELVERLRKGQRVVAGQRVRYLSSTFEVLAELRLSGHEALVCSAGAGESDSLPGVPVF